MGQLYSYFAGGPLDSQDLTNTRLARAYLARLGFEATTDPTTHTTKATSEYVDDVFTLVVEPPEYRVVCDHPESDTLIKKTDSYSAALESLYDNARSACDTQPGSMARMLSVAAISMSPRQYSFNHEFEGSFRCVLRRSNPVDSEIVIGISQRTCDGTPLTDGFAYRFWSSYEARSTKAHSDTMYKSTDFEHYTDAFLACVETMEAFDAGVPWPPPDSDSGSDAPSDAEDDPLPTDAAPSDNPPTQSLV